MERLNATIGSIEGSRWGAIIPMAVAAALGLYTIGDKSIWLDEGFSARVIDLPTKLLAAFLWHTELQASPYYLALQLWSVLGHGEAALRSLSVVFGVVGVLATWAIGRRYGVGFAAALLLAVSPFFVHYEQEMRVYALLVAWSGLTTLAYLRLVDRPNRWRAGTYVLAAAVLIYLHPLSGWMLVAHALATLLLVEARWRWRLLALYIPVLIASLPMIRYGILNHERALWIPAATPAYVVDSLSQLMGSALLAIALTIVLVLGLGRVWRRELPALAVPILIVIVMVGGILLMSWLIQPLLVDRYLIGVLPFLFVVLARAINALPVPRLIVGALVSLSLIGVTSWYVAGFKDDWRGAAAYVNAGAEPTDGVVFYPNWYRLPFTYYTTVGQPLYPSTPWSASYLPFTGMDDDLPPDLVSPRIWLVRSVQAGPPTDLATLLAHYQVVDTRVFGPEEPRVDLLVRRP
jgi:uncharacterized membrane protein